MILKIIIIILILISSKYSLTKNICNHETVKYYNKNYSKPEISKSYKTFNSNVQNNEPIIICSDQCLYDNNQSKITYKEKVFVIQAKNIQIHADNMSKKDSCTSTIKTFNFKDTKNKNHYTNQPLTILNFIHHSTIEKKNCRILSGKTLEITLNEKQNIDIIMLSNLDHKIQFYNRNNLTNNKHQEIYAEAKNIILNIKNQFLKLEKNIYIKNYNNIIHSNKILYDYKNKVIFIPKNKKHTTVILNINTFKI